MAKAISWEKCFENESLLTTKEDFITFIDYFDHDNVLLQALSAKIIGASYQDWLDEDEFQGETQMPLVHMLGLIAKKQKQGSYVTGGFINGISSGSGNGFHDLKINKTLNSSDFDLNEWIINVVLNAQDGGEPNIPTAQSFWFYVHEYFDFNAQAIHRIIDGKKYWIAMMCATESLNAGSYKIMKPILERLIKEAPEQISKQCNYHLKLNTKH